MDLLAGIDILSTTVNKVTNKIFAQAGAKEGIGESDNIEWWQHVGLASRPSSPSALGNVMRTAQALIFRRGGRDIAFASQDVRSLELYGLLKPGETALYGAGKDGKSQGRVLVKDDGSINMFTTHDNTATGRSVYLRVAPDEIVMNAPWGTMRFDATGFHVAHASGPTFNMGGIAGVPAPLDVIASYIKMQAGVISQESSLQTNGVGGGGALAAALPVTEAIAALQSEVIAINAALVKLASHAVPNPASPLLASHAVEAAAIVTPVVTAQTIALAGATPLIPTTTTSA